MSFLLNSTYKWYYMRFLFLWLTWYDSLWIHPCCCKWCNFMIFNGWVITHCLNITSSFCSPLSVDSYCLHVLVTVSSAAMNIGLHVSVHIIVYSCYVPGTGIAGSYGGSIFSFWGTFTLFSIVTAMIYIPTNM